MWFRGSWSSNSFYFCSQGCFHSKKYSFAPRSTCLAEKVYGLNLMGSIAIFIYDKSIIFDEIKAWMVHHDKYGQTQAKFSLHLVLQSMVIRYIRFQHEGNIFLTKPNYNYPARTCITYLNEVVESPLRLTIYSNHFVMTSTYGCQMVSFH
jgi:hypothetical protein